MESEDIEDQEDDKNRTSATGWCNETWRMTTRGSK